MTTFDDLHVQSEDDAATPCHDCGTMYPPDDLNDDGLCDDCLAFLPEDDGSDHEYDRMKETP